MTRVEIDVPTRPVLAHAADAVVAGGLVFLAGILPLAADGSVVPGGVRGQAQHVAGELRAVLAAAGSEPDRLVSVDVFLLRAEDAVTVEQALRQALGSTRVAGSVVVVTGLAVPGALVEVDAVALVR